MYVCMYATRCHFPRHWHLPSRLHGVTFLNCGSFPPPVLWPFTFPFTFFDIFLSSLHLWAKENRILTFHFTNWTVFKFPHKFTHCMWPFFTTYLLMAGTFSFKCLFPHLLILPVMFHIFLELESSNKEYTVKNKSRWSCSKFGNNPYIFM